MFQSKNLSTSEALNLSAQTMKVDVGEMYQTDPLELVTCSYASGVDEEGLKIIPNVTNNIKAISSRDTKKETLNHNNNFEKLSSENDDTTERACSDCGVTFKIHEQVDIKFCTGCREERKKINENNNALFECDICSKVFHSKFTLAKHFKYHLQVIKFKCCVCNLKFTNSNTLEIHFKSMHKESSNLKCTLCKTAKQYKSVKPFLTHINKMHESTSVETVNVCPTERCSERDTRNKIEKLLPDLTNKNCKQESKDKKTIAKSSKRDGKPKCKNQYERKDPSLCSYCGKVFSTVTRLSQHIRITHLCLKQHECKFCAKRFSTTSGLRNHVEAIHDKKKFQCTLCGGLLSSSNGLQSHMRKHANRNKEPTITCPVCPKLFRQKKNLDRHMRSHTGETPFKCSHCPREFTLQWNLIQHERLHTGEKRYKCEKCGKAFTHNVSRKNHMKYHKDKMWEHGNEPSVDTGTCML